MESEMVFEWGEIKASANLRDHGVSFDEAREAFRDPRGVYDYDPDHSTPDEHRYTLIGFSSRHLLFVVYTMRMDEQAVRIIHARVANKRMEKYYVQSNS